MERRVIFAIVLMMIVALLPTIIWPRKPPVRRADGPTDRTPVTSARDSARAAAPVTPSVGPSVRRSVAASDTVAFDAPLYRYSFSTTGLGMVEALLKDYHSTAPGDSGRPAQLVPPGQPLLGIRLVVGNDTISFNDMEFSLATQHDDPGLAQATRRWLARSGSLSVEIAHTYRTDSYLYSVNGRVTGLGSGAVLLLDLGQGVKSVESDSVGDYNNFALVTKSDRTRSLSFSSLDPGEADTLSGPLEWVAFKTKYFVVAALAVDPGAPRWGGAVAVGGPRQGKLATRLASATATLPVLPDGVFRFQVYAGPIEVRRLSAIGHDLDDVNPYGWIFRPIVRPVADVVTRFLVWMHESLNVAYGVALIFFGLLVRVVLWPLNQKAMESGIKMQAIQPEMKALQDRYRDNPQKLQEEMLRLYREHGVNPVGGCLPMLLPLPVLIALFFVFANTIEFRGVPFLWLPDLSLHDPIYVMPILMGASMFALQKIGMSGMPPNPQSKMMLYFMPLFMTFVLFRFSSGLNLYYTAQNIFSLPQQYLIAKRRAKMAAERQKPKKR
jgi:YidC/Oxa1 family membrane protein insertase